MKKLIYLTLFIAFINVSNAQSVSYSQLHGIFSTLTTSQTNTIHEITLQLRKISPKWQLITHKPITDGETKYYYWRAKESGLDSSALAIYIDEDDSTVKYSLRYAFHNKALYDALLHSLNSSSYYPTGSITSFTDNSKGEFTITAMASDTLPMASRIDFTLSDYNSNAGSNPRLFTVDIMTRYIPK